MPTATLVSASSLLIGQSLPAWTVRAIAHPGVITHARRSETSRGEAMLKDEPLESMPAVLMSAENAVVVKDKAFIVAEDGSTLADFFASLLGRDPQYEFRYRAERIAELDAPAMVLGNLYIKNYSHWMTQVLPSALIYAAHASGEPYFVTPPLSPWQRESLDIFVGRYRIYEKPADGAVRLPRAYTCSLMFNHSHSLMLSPGAIQRVRAAAPQLGQRRGRRICISRADARARRLRNATELYDLMRGAGFDVVTLDGLTVREQIALMQEADIVAGEHGAGLTNVMFARAPRLIEFMPRGRPNGAFPRLAAMCGASTSRLYGSSLDEEDTWEIDLDDVASVVRAVAA